MEIRVPINEAIKAKLKKSFDHLNMAAAAVKQAKGAEHMAMNRIVEMISTILAMREENVTNTLLRSEIVGDELVLTYKAEEQVTETKSTNSGKDQT